MTFAIWETFLIVQCLASGIEGQVSNIVKSKIIFSNQELLEKNIEIVRKIDKTILSKNEIYEFLMRHLPEQYETRLKDLLDVMGPKELRHIDLLIYLMSYYKTASKYLLQSIFEILKEDETNFNSLMRNFGSFQPQQQIAG